MNARNRDLRVQAWIKAREAEKEAASKVPFCSFDGSKALTAGRYRVEVKGRTLTVWKS